MLANKAAQYPGGWSKEAITALVGAILAPILAILVPLIRAWWRRRLAKQEQNRGLELPDEGGQTDSMLSISSCLFWNEIKERQFGPEAGRKQTPKWEGPFARQVAMII
jgi:hypothetical protein